MSVPGIEFPVAFEAIPAEVKRLTEIIRSRDADVRVARELLALVRRGCGHEKAERGYNERDGSWMNACPHCGETE